MPNGPVLRGDDIGDDDDGDEDDDDDDDDEDDPSKKQSIVHTEDGRVRRRAVFPVDGSKPLTKMSHQRDNNSDEEDEEDDDMDDDDEDMSMKWKQNLGGKAATAPLSALQTIGGV